MRHRRAWWFYHSLYLSVNLEKKSLTNTTGAAKHKLAAPVGKANIWAFLLQPLSAMAPTRHPHNCAKNARRGNLFRRRMKPSLRGPPHKRFSQDAALSGAPTHSYAFVFSRLQNSSHFAHGRRRKNTLQERRCVAPISLAPYLTKQPPPHPSES